MKQKLARLALVVGIVGTSFLGVAGVAQADCEATPTAQVCSEEVSTSLVSSVSSVIGGNLVIIVPLIALAMAIGIVLRFVFKAGRRVGS